MRMENSHFTFSFHNLSEQGSTKFNPNLITSRVDDPLISRISPSNQIFSFYSYYWYMLIMCLIGILGNGGVVLAFKFDPTLYHNLANVFVANLSVADLAICLLCGPLYLIMAFTLSQNYGRQLLACRIMGGLNVFMFCESLYSLALIGINRFVIVTKSPALQHKWFGGSRRIWSWIFVSWLASLILTLLPLIQHIDVGEFGYHKKFRGCLWNDSLHNTRINWGVIISLFCMIPSIAAATYCYFKIFLIVKQSKLRVQGKIILCNPSLITSLRHLAHQKLNLAPTSKVSPELEEPVNPIQIVSTLSPSNSNLTRESSNIPTSAFLRRFRRDNKTNIYLLIFFVAFTICWFPWNIIVLLEKFIHFPLWFFRLAPVLSITNSSINPFMYGLMNRKFRSPYLKLFSYFRRRNR